MQATVRIFNAETRSGSVYLDDGTEIPFDAAAFDAGPLRLLRSGQRVNIVVDDGRITYITLSTFPTPGSASASGQGPSPAQAPA
ncbi:hypothetical protein AB0395_17600 [Streptosporangium sp. NPDC051023]|uniref:hypothetical protein n=1 Tax=Streptosporangium sp. NPDC051023 TaxID=3155410 RepID=UPI0034504AD4